MALVKWRPFEEMDLFRREFDRLFESFFHPIPAEPGAREWLPSVDMEETKDEVIVKAELPGVEEKDVQISLMGDNLVIKGEKKREHEEKGKHYHRVERSYGSFMRSVILPSTVNSEKVKADYSKGVLTITLPKKEEAKPKEIKINVDH